MHDAPFATLPEAEESALARVSRAVVGEYKDRLGRGPDRARTDWAGPDAVVCRLWRTMTTAERALSALGERDRLRAARLVLADAGGAGLGEVVSAILGREVRTVVSGIDVPLDMAVEVMVLAPRAA